MRAAVVTELGQPPRCTELPEPQASGPGQVVVEVLAAGLHPRVRSQAAGTHYTSTDELPLVPGIDGVGRAPDGSLRYFVLPDTVLGSLSERVAIDLRRSVELPADADPVRLAAAMNPAMSSWVALRRRIRFEAGQSVLVLGATGSAGRLAVQVARRLGAGRVVAVGRDADALAGALARGADEAVALGDAGALAAAGAEADVVLDYLWGRPAADALVAIVPHRVEESQPLAWVQLGSAAGLESSIPSAALRAIPLQLVGSGQGSVPTRAIVAELPGLAAELADDAFDVRARPVPLSAVEEAWTEAAATCDRLVVVP